MADRAYLQSLIDKSLNEVPENEASVTQPQTVDIETDQFSVADRRKAAIDEVLQRNQEELNATARIAVKEKPDDYERKFTVATQLGLKPEDIRGDVKHAQEVATFNRMDLARLARVQPMLAAWLQKPNNMQLTHDDIESGALPQLANAWTNGMQQVKFALRANELMKAGLDPTTDPEMMELEKQLQVGGQRVEDAQRPLKTLVKGIQVIPGMGLGLIGSAGGAAVAGGLAVETGALPLVPFAAAGGAAIGGGYSTYLQESGAAYHQYVKEARARGGPVDLAGAKLAAEGVGTINGMIDAVGFVGMLRFLPGLKILVPLEKAAVQQTIRQIVGKAVLGYGKELISESVQEGVQRVVTDVGQNIALGDPTDIDDLAKGFTEETFTSLEAFVLTGGIGAGLSMSNQFRNYSAGVKAEADFREYGRLVDQANVSKRAPEKLGEVAGIGVEAGHPPTVFVSVENFDKLFQSDLTPQAAADQLGIGEERTQALEQGTEMAIPFEKYASKIANTPYQSSLSGDLRYDQEASTFNEREAFRAKLPDFLNLLEEVKAKNDETIKKLEETPTYDLIYKQLKQTGRVSEKDAKFNATLFSAFNLTMGERTGANMLERFPLVITAADEAQATLNQADRLTGQDLSDAVDTMKQQIQDAHPDLDAFEAWVGQGGDLYLANITVGDDARGRGVGTSALKQLTDFADQHGLTVSLDPQADRGKRHALQRFYRRAGFFPKHGGRSGYAPWTAGTWVRHPQKRSEPTKLSQAAVAEETERSEILGRTVHQIRENIGENALVAGKHEDGQPMTMVDGKPFLEANLDEAGDGWAGSDRDLQAIVTNAFKDAVGETTRGAEVVSGLDEKMAPKDAAFWARALKLQNRARFWYEISAEYFRAVFPELDNEELARFIDIVAATSPQADPYLNIQRAVGVLSESMQHVPIASDIISPASVRAALSGKGLEGPKVRSFSGTMQYVIGLAGERPLSTNDRQVASTFGLKADTIAQNPVLYEVLSRFYINLRDSLNANLPKGAEPYQTWQLQALGWVQERYEKERAGGREVTTSDDYQQALGRVIDKLAAARMDVSGGITVETLQKPEVPNLLSRTREAYLESPIATIEVQTLLTESGPAIKETVERARATGDVLSLNEFDSITKRAFAGLGKRDKTGTSLAERLAEVIKGEKVRISRVVNGHGTYEGNVGANIRLPMGGLNEFELETFLSVIGEAWQQGAMAASSFRSVPENDVMSEPWLGFVRTYQIFLENRVALSNAEIAAFSEALGGNELNINPNIANGITVDINPSFGEEGMVGPDPDVVLAAAEKVFGAHTFETFPKNYKSTYIERADYPAKVKAHGETARQKAVESIVGKSGLDPALVDKYLQTTQPAAARKLLDRAAATGARAGQRRSRSVTASEEARAGKVKAQLQSRLASLDTLQVEAATILSDYERTLVSTWKPKADKRYERSQREAVAQRKDNREADAEFAAAPIEEAEQPTDEEPVTLAQRAAARTDTPEFRAWFEGASDEVKNPDGSPIVIYRGESGGGRGVLAGGTYEPGATYWSSDPTTASSYAIANAAKRDARGRVVGGAVVIPAFVNMKDPLVVVAPDYTSWDSVPFEDGVYAVGDLIRVAKDRGNDGLIVRNVVDSADVAGDPQDTYVTLDPAQVKSSIGNVGAFDPNDPNILKQEALGSITLMVGKQPYVINLGPKADLSTFLHESAHMFIDVMGKLAQEEGAPQQIKEDYETSLKWMGYESHEDRVASFAEMRQINKRVKEGTATDADKARLALLTEKEEKWARGFEAYLMEGKAPSAPLARAFTRFARWLTTIYRKISTLNVDVPPEIKSVMNRMIATDEQIAQVEEHDKYIPMFSNAAEAGMTEPQFVRYQNIAEEAHWEAYRNLDLKIRAEQEREDKAWWKEEKAEVQKTVTTEIDAKPSVRARQFLRDGSLPPDMEENRQALEKNGAPMKISTESLDQMYGQLSRDVKRKLGPNAVRILDGVHPDAIAQHFGFRNGDEMVRAMVSEPTRAIQIAQETSRRMAERHGSIRTDGTLEAASRLAVHESGKRLQHLQMELDAMNRQAGHRTVKLSKEMLQRYADEQIQKSKVRSVDPNRYLQAERKAATEAFKAAEKGKWDEAIDWQKKRMINRFLYSAAMDAKKTTDAAVKFLRKQDTTQARQKLGLMDTIDPDTGAVTHSYLDQQDKLLERTDLRKISAPEARARESLAKWIEVETAALRDPVIDPRLIDESRTINWQDMTVDELLALTDAVHNIKHLAHLKSTIKVGREEKDYDSLVKEGQAQIQQRARQLGPTSISQTNQTWRERILADPIRFIDSELVRMRELANELDGDDPNGLFHRILIHPLDDAEAAEHELNRKVTKLIDDAITLLPAKVRAQLASRETVLIPSINRTFTYSDLMAFALNQGNESNKYKLLLGWQTTRQGNIPWTAQTITELRSHLREEHWDFAQSIWDALETLWPEAAALEKRKTGLAPKKVDAAAFDITLPDGTKKSYRGGYYPILYDPRFAAREQQNTDPGAALYDKTHERAITPHGHLKERVENYVAPISLKFDRLLGSIVSVVHDTTHREALTEAYRYMTDQRIADAMIQHMGEDYYKAILERLRKVANSRNQQGRLLNAMHYVQGSVSAAVMAYKMTVILQNFANPVLASVAVGPIRFAMGFAKWATSPFDSTDRIKQLSTFMRFRSDNMSQELNQIYQRRVGFGASKRKVIQHQAKLLGHKLMAYTNMATEWPAWMAEFNNAEARGLSQEQAVRAADDMIASTFGSGSVKDLALAQDREGMRWFTAFYGFFSAVYNMTRRAKRQIGGKWSSGRKGAAAGQALSYLAFNMVLMSVASEILSGRPPDDDDLEDSGTLAQWMFGRAASYTFGMIPFVRDVARTVEYKRGVSLTPLSSAGEEFAKVITEVAEAGEHLIEDGELAEDDIIDLATQGAKTVGMFTGFPVSQFNITGGFLWDFLVNDKAPEEWSTGLHDLLYKKKKKGA